MEKLIIDAGEYGEFMQTENNLKLIAKKIKNKETFYINLDLPCHTRHEIVFSSLDCTFSYTVGFNEEYTIISVIRKGSYPFNLKNYCSPGYIAEKLNVGIPESKDLSDFFMKIGEYL